MDKQSEELHVQIVSGPECKSAGNGGSNWWEVRENGNVVGHEVNDDHLNFERSPWLQRDQHK
jgi:hypothetical protein